MTKIHFATPIKIYKDEKWRTSYLEIKNCHPNQKRKTEARSGFEPRWWCRRKGGDMTRDLLYEIARGVGLSASDVARVISDAPARYKVFSIRKKRGVGTRTISQPSPPLKLIQRYLVSNVLNSLPISLAAFAYRPEINIGLNARRHLGSKFLLKLDFKDFFASIEPRDLLSRLQHFEWLSQQNQTILTQALYWRSLGRLKLSLAIGAPSSPTISNIVMYQLDEAIAERARRAGIVYTRYADDMTFSGNYLDALREMESEVRALIEMTNSPRLQFNDSKRGIYQRGMKQMVTGLILTPDGYVSIGRARKRLISAGVHRIKKNGFAEEGQVQNIRGWIAFANSVEPEFVRRLEKRYGEIVKQILHLPFAYKSTLFYGKILAPTLPHKEDS
jgi:hypothetical protein